LPIGTRWKFEGLAAWWAIHYRDTVMLLFMLVSAVNVCVSSVNISNININIQIKEDNPAQINQDWRRVMW